jgi:hypothetical protein
VIAYTAKQKQEQQYAYYWNRLIADPERTLLSALQWATGPAMALNGERASTITVLAVALAAVAEERGEPKPCRVPVVEVMG